MEIADAALRGTHRSLLHTIASSDWHLGSLGPYRKDGMGSWGVMSMRGSMMRPDWFASSFAFLRTIIGIGKLLNGSHPLVDGAR